MNNKRVTLFAGHYGSGKTNIAVNYALHLKEKYENVVITDLDIVNPYFRTADSLEELQNAGIKLISSEFANSNVDLPALPQDVYSILDDKSAVAILDIGGDEVVLHPEELKPEERKQVEHPALVRHAAGKNDVERADAVGHHHQQRVAEIEDVAHLAALPRQFRYLALQERLVLVVFHNAAIIA